VKCAFLSECPRRKKRAMRPWGPHNNYAASGSTDLWINEDLLWKYNEEDLLADKKACIR
jgi:hypothetical protein